MPSDPHDGRDIKLIEDCAQAHGALYKGHPVGSGDVAALVFCQDKIMTTGGEGGMVTCNDEHWKRMWSIKDHGKDYDAVHAPVERPGFRWLHDRFGTNWRLTEMQSAIGMIQLGRMADWTALRQRNAIILLAALALMGEKMAQQDCRPRDARDATAVAQTADVITAGIGSMFLYAGRALRMAGRETASYRSYRISVCPACRGHALKSILKGLLRKTTVTQSRDLKRHAGLAKPASPF